MRARWLGFAAVELSQSRRFLSLDAASASLNALWENMRDAAQKRDEDDDNSANSDHKVRLFKFDPLPDGGRGSFVLTCKIAAKYPGEKSSLWELLDAAEKASVLMTCTITHFCAMATWSWSHVRKREAAVDLRPLSEREIRMLSASLLLTGLWSGRVDGHDHGAPEILRNIFVRSQRVRAHNVCRRIQPRDEASWTNIPRRVMIALQSKLESVLFMDKEKHELHLELNKDFLDAFLACESERLGEAVWDVLPLPNSICASVELRQTQETRTYAYKVQVYEDTIDGPRAIFASVRFENFETRFDTELLQPLVDSRLVTRKDDRVETVQRQMSIRDGELSIALPWDFIPTVDWTGQKIATAAVSCPQRPKKSLAACHCRPLKSSTTRVAHSSPRSSRLFLSCSRLKPRSACNADNLRRRRLHVAECRSAEGERSRSRTLS